MWSGEYFVVVYVISIMHFYILAGSWGSRYPQPYAVIMNVQENPSDKQHMVELSCQVLHHNSMVVTERKNSIPSRGNRENYFTALPEHTTSFLPHLHLSIQGQTSYFITNLTVVILTLNETYWMTAKTKESVKVPQFLFEHVLNIVSAFCEH